MTEMITLTIDDISVTVPEGTTILKAANQAGIADIPTLCYHEYCTSNGLCRICVVEVEGARTLIPSCCTKVTAGMKVHTQSNRIDRARRTTLEMLNASVDLSDAPDVQGLMQDYMVKKDRFPYALQRRSPILDDNPMYIRDYSKCVLCWRCVQVCAEDAQFTYAINFSGRGFETQISTAYEKPLLESTCVVCGQCVAVCPSGALKPKREWLLEQGLSVDEVMDLTRHERQPKRQDRKP